MFFIPNQITGCIDYDKLSLFLKYHGSTTMGIDFKKKSTSIMSNFFHRWDSLCRKENSIEERIKSIHYLTSNENIYQHVFIINSTTTNYQVEKEKNMLSTIEYLISNDLLDSFGYNFIFIIIETISNIVKENNKYHCLHENIITELEFLELIKLILLKSKGTQRERPIKTHIKEVSKSNEFYKILLFFENKETNFGQFFQSIEFKEFKSLETKLDMIDKMFLNENNVIKILKLGYPEYLLDLFTRKPNFNSI